MLPIEVWSLDFDRGLLSNGEKFLALRIVDFFTSAELAIEVGHRLPGEHVVEALNRLVRTCVAPKYLFSDNRTEFTAHLVDLLGYHHGVPIDFLRPGKHANDAFIETFNG